MTRVLLWLPLALLLAACLVMNLAALRLRSQRRRADRRAARYVTDLCAVLPLTPLPPRTRAYKRPPQVPRIAPDVPRPFPQYVIDALGGHRTVDECVDSIVMRAVKP